MDLAASHEQPSTYKDGGTPEIAATIHVHSMTHLMVTPMLKPKESMNMIGIRL